MTNSQLIDPHTLTQLQQTVIDALNLADKSGLIEVGISLDRALHLLAATMKAQGLGSNIIEVTVPDQHTGKSIGREL